MRLFTAMPVPVHIRREIADFQEKAGKEFPDGSMRWVQPDNIHLTLKFLGESPQNKIEKIISIVRNSVDGHCAFNIRIAGCGVFPSPGRPRVLWLGCIDDTGTAADIKEYLDRKLKRFGYEKEKRKYSPHLTVARVKKPGIPLTGGISRIISREIDLGTVEVRSIQLIESILKPSGAEYRIIEDAEFRL
ncbi:MAG: RNA 2',3'-cyclic phosphodiesterase [Elusimicrobiota bacterium]